MQHKVQTDGFLKGNAVLAQGMVIAPVVVCCDTLQKALLLSLAFACITIVTVLLCSFYPKKPAYAVRVVLYALTAAVVFIPVSLLCEYISPSVYAAFGTAEVPGGVSGAGMMYLPLLTVNSFIVLHSELYFYRLRRSVMLVSLLRHTAGFCLAACVMGCIRELLAYGSVFGHVVDMPLLLKGFSSPWGGFIVLGALCALHRRLFPKKGE